MLLLLSGKEHSWFLDQDTLIISHYCKKMYLLLENNLLNLVHRGNVKNENMMAFWRTVKLSNHI